MIPRANFRRTMPDPEALKASRAFQAPATPPAALTPPEMPGRTAAPWYRGCWPIRGPGPRASAPSGTRPRSMMTFRFDRGATPTQTQRRNSTQTQRQTQRKRNANARPANLLTPCPPHAHRARPVRAFSCPAFGTHPPEPGRLIGNHYRAQLLRVMRYSLLRELSNACAHRCYLSTGADTNCESAVGHGSGQVSSGPREDEAQGHAGTRQGARKRDPGEPLRAAPRHARRPVLRFLYFVILSARVSRSCRKPVRVSPSSARPSRSCRGRVPIGALPLRSHPGPPAPGHCARGPAGGSSGEDPRGRATTSQDRAPVGPGDGAPPPWLLRPRSGGIVGAAVRVRGNLKVRSCDPRGDASDRPRGKVRGPTAERADERKSAPMDP